MIRLISIDVFEMSTLLVSGLPTILCRSVTVRRDLILRSGPGVNVFHDFLDNIHVAFNLLVFFRVYIAWYSIVYNVIFFLVKRNVGAAPRAKHFFYLKDGYSTLYNPLKHS